MDKTFEESFSKIQSEMVSTCLDYCEKKVETIFIFLFFRDSNITSTYFFKHNGVIVRNLEACEDFLFESPKQINVSRIIARLACDLEDLCEEWEQATPTEAKLTYDVQTGEFDAKYRYDDVNDILVNGKIAADISAEWIAELEASLE